MCGDPSDAVYVALALELRRQYGKVVILTWNKKDFRIRTLRDAGIDVLTPLEFVRRFFG